MGNVQELEALCQGEGETLHQRRPDSVLVHCYSRPVPLVLDSYRLHRWQHDPVQQSETELLPDQLADASSLNHPDSLVNSHLWLLANSLATEIPPARRCNAPVTTMIVLKVEQVAEQSCH